MGKKYWKSLPEVQPSEDQQTDRPSEADSGLSAVEILSDPANHTESSRRDFLKWCGISFVSATVLSACENPVKKAIPYLNQPEMLTPGKASWYASTYIQGNQWLPIVVKNRDGRPIKIEGNEQSGLTSGGTTARVQASILSLYDSGARYRNPMKDSQSVSWEAADQQIIQNIRDLKKQGKRLVLLTPTLLSPSTEALIKQFSDAFSGIETICWDPISYSGIRKAHGLCFGQEVLPDMYFDKAELIVGFSADFLGSWLAPAIFAKRYSATRKPGAETPAMSHHIQYESHMSITGAGADKRHAVSPREELNILFSLHDALAKRTGYPLIGANSEDSDTLALAEKLIKHRGKSLVVCGHNHAGIQSVVAAINYMCGAYGETLDVSSSLLAGKSDEIAFSQLLGDMEQEKIGGIMFYQSNPVYHCQEGDRFAQALQKVPLSVSFAVTRDETASLCQWIIPDNHYLESWNDAMFKQGYRSLAQPLIHPLYDTRAFQDTLLHWMQSEQDFHSFLRMYWEREVFPAQSFHQGFDGFWTHSLQSGIHENANLPAISVSLNQAAVGNAAQSMKADLAKRWPAGNETAYVLYANVAMYDGTDANNPWLQELPDPISSVCWDNFAAVSPATARAMGVAEGEVIRLNARLSLPVLFQPGMAEGTIGIPMGYGRTQAGVSADGRGGNAFLLSESDGESRWFTGPVLQWEKTGEKHVFARTQTHFSMEGRAIVRESVLDKYKQDPASGNELHKYHEKHKTTLYPAIEHPGHHWALMVDLNACTGCSACVIGCQSENNIPVIGKDQVRRRRIMHWMRIDRYYTGSTENPGVVFQPLMCQHCDHAPCENVCPVAATTHSQEGINQITYNRCVGTKYCINNCPYKVRRFNWYEYATKEKFNTHTTTELGRMVLNPDVTVRERGVVEKCSFCVQRIQEAKLRAKNERRKLRDGEIIPACAQACPSGALVFGDLNDKNSRVAQMIKDPRNYHLLEELHTLPSVGYLTKIRNA